MTLKKSYKIIISVIIVAILVSTSTILYFELPRTEHYNDVRSYEMKYYHYGHISEKPYNVTSYSVTGNKVSYLNSTMSCICIEPIAGGTTISFKINVYKNYPGPITIHTNRPDMEFDQNGTCFLFPTYPITLQNNSPYFNFTLKVSSGRLYNVFHLVTIKSSAVYGCVEYPHTGNIDRVNGEFIIENENNSHMNIVNVHNGYYYYFVHPDTGYNLYSIKNSTLKQIGTIGNKTISSGSSHRYVIYSDEL